MAVFGIELEPYISFEGPHVVHDERFDCAGSEYQNAASFLTVATLAYSTYYIDIFSWTCTSIRIRIWHMYIRK